MHASLDNILAKVFPPATRYSFYVIMAAGLINLAFQPIAGFVAILVSIFVIFAQNGLCLDPQKNQYQSYTKFLGLKMGKWQSLEEYADLCILKTKQSTKAYSRAMVESETSSEVFYDIYLVSKNHRKKLLIKRSSLFDQAKIEAELLAQALERPLVAYQPQLSAASQARRARRR